MRVVLANGCFDVLHIGHKWHLEQARALGDRLVVSLTVDEHVNKGPGRPVNPWAHRAELLLALRAVDEVVPSRNAVQAILMVRPHVFVKGIDYAGDGKLNAEREVCMMVGAKLITTTSPKMGSGDILRRMHG